MNIKKTIIKFIAAVMLPAALLTGCGDGGSGGTVSDVPPDEILKAVMDEVTVSSAATKDESELEVYYKDIDASKVESAALCLSVGHPDEIAIIKFKDDSDAKSAEAALQKRLEEQKRTYESYDPENMYKLEGAKIYSKGSYTIFLAVEDNDKAKSIVDEKLAG